MILDGKIVAKNKMDLIKKNIDIIVDKYKFNPELKLIQIGNDEATNIYVNSKIKRGKKLGINVTLDKFDNISKELLVNKIKNYSINKNINGIMVESPLPGNLNFYDIVNYIPFYKDSDGMTSYNEGNLSLKNEMIAPATARAVVDILEYYNIKERNAVIINRSPVVGRPLAMMLLNRDYTVTVCHSKTENIKKITKNSNIIIVAVGKKNFIDNTFVNKNSIIIDVGINYENNKIYGDANYNDLLNNVKAITPVPGGVGIVTATDIFQNFLNGLNYQLKNY